MMDLKKNGNASLAFYMSLNEPKTAMMTLSVAETEISGIQINQNVFELAA